MFKERWRQSRKVIFSQPAYSGLGSWVDWASTGRSGRRGPHPGRNALPSPAHPPPPPHSLGLKQLRPSAVPGRPVHCTCTALARGRKDVAPTLTWENVQTPHRKWPCSGLIFLTDIITKWCWTKHCYLRTCHVWRSLMGKSFCGIDDNMFLSSLRQDKSGETDTRLGYCISWTVNCKKWRSLNERHHC